MVSSFAGLMLLTSLLVCQLGMSFGARDVSHSNVPSIAEARSVWERNRARYDISMKMPGDIDEEANGCTGNVWSSATNTNCVYLTKTYCGYGFTQGTNCYSPYATVYYPVSICKDRRLYTVTLQMSVAKIPNSGRARFTFFGAVSLHWTFPNQVFWCRNGAKSVSSTNYGGCTHLCYSGVRPYSGKQNIKLVFWYDGFSIWENGKYLTKYDGPAVRPFPYTNDIKFEISGSLSGGYEFKYDNLYVS